MKLSPLSMFLMMCIALGVQNQPVRFANNKQLHSLNQIINIEATSLECNQALSDLNNSADTWSDIMKNQEQIDIEVSQLLQMKTHLQKDGKSATSEKKYQSGFIELRKTFDESIDHNNQNNIALSPYQKWRNENNQELQHAISLLEKAENDQDLENFTENIEVLIDKLIYEKEEIKKQYQDTLGVTISMVNTKADEIKKKANQCNENSSQEISTNNFLNYYSNTQNPVFEEIQGNAENLVEYGYGFWMRFLTKYPEQLINGKNQPWYFISRLTTNVEDKNIKMGDRALSLWQGQGFYHFTTCDERTKNVNVVQNINYPEDIEGLWTFIYYSYSKKINRAAGFIQFGNDQIQQIAFEVEHPITNQIKFILGGNDQNRYPHFNGIFTQIKFNSKEGTFIENKDHFRQIQQSLIALSQAFDGLTNYQVIKDSISRTSNDKPLKLDLVNESERFPSQYSFSGWFKWQQIIQRPWHTIFRVQIKSPSTDYTLGDRTLSAWVGAENEGIIQFTTYTYSNMNGEGKPNIWQNIQHNNKHMNWFYIYFGYSKVQKKAFALIKWTNNEDKVIYDNINHYYSSQFYLFVGGCEFFPGFNGEIGYVNFNLGDGSFRDIQDQIYSNEIFGYQMGLTSLVNNVKDNFFVGQVNNNLYENGFTQEHPIIDEEVQAQMSFEQYGYGFWMRFLTKYPEQLINGKNKPFYFVSRLANQKDYGNIRMGDRILAIWQGQGYYHFTTCSTQIQNPNLIQNINYPDDIEGVWTYIYYSYDSNENKAIGYIKYGNTEFQNITHNVIHPQTKYLRFILGGNDAKRYPGFNGQFTSITFSTESSFIQDVDKLNIQNQYIDQTYPFKVFELINDTIVRKQDDTPSYNQQLSQQNQFPFEYAISGWYKWETIQEQSWHNVFRVQIYKDQITDNNLGDRVLACWVGKSSGGVLSFSTYTYTNMLGEGNNNLYNNIQHNNKLRDWFYIYFGYSKKQEKGQIYVKWFDDQEENDKFQNTKHYFTSQFQIFIGRDQQFMGFNGQIAYVNFYAGDGAFVENNQFNDVEDIFRCRLIIIDVLNKNDQQNDGKKLIQTQNNQVFQPSEVNQQIFENSADQDLPVLNLERYQDNYFAEYGYGFWIRYLTLYPTIQQYGLNRPWNFISRLANRQNYDNIEMGDRTLAVWLGEGFFQFATINSATGDNNMCQNIYHPRDIEGLWIYIYYSYQTSSQQAIGLIKFEGFDNQQIHHSTIHPQNQYLRLILGGAFAASIQELENYLQLNPHPRQGLKIQNFQIVTNPISRDLQTDGIFKIIQDPQYQFPYEYSISGWFKWVNIDQIPIGWQNLFKVSARKELDIDLQLTDRILGCWIGSKQFLFLSYTYINMQGQGDKDSLKALNHNNRHAEWFFVYHGYTKYEKIVYSYIEYSNQESDFTIAENQNHYFTPKFHVWVGKDVSGFQGQIANVFFNSGPGSYRQGDYSHPENYFGYDLSVKENSSTQNGYQINDIITSSIGQQEPSLVKIFKQTEIENIQEYGYFFWIRYLAQYPKSNRIVLPDEWTFISRLTRNKQLGDAELGDRTLSIFFHKAGVYYFISCDYEYGTYVNSDVKNDIEGIWAYIYYAHSLIQHKNIVFFQFGDEPIQKLEQSAFHYQPNFLKFYLGGKDFYGSWNGQFSSITITSQKGIYIEDEQQIKLKMQFYKKPEQFNNELKTVQVIQTAQDFDENTQIKQYFYDNGYALKSEYAWSGWFKYNGTPTGRNLLSRLSIFKDHKDLELAGDSALAAWIIGDKNQFHFSTYKYDHLGDQGIVDSSNRFNYGTEINYWFFIYFGYSLTLKSAFYRVEFYQKIQEFLFQDHKHYYPNIFSLNIGQDGYTKPWIGKISYFQFNVGLGAYRVKDYGGIQGDLFNYKIISNIYSIQNQQTSKFFNDTYIGTINVDLDSDNPAFEKKYEGLDVNKINEYGFSLWTRNFQFVQSFQTALCYVTPSANIYETRKIALLVSTFSNNYFSFWYSFSAYPLNQFETPQSADYLNIQGFWTYIHFSYSYTKKQAIGFQKNIEGVKSINLISDQIKSQLLIFRIGYPLLMTFFKKNLGQIRNIIFSTKDGIFLSDIKSFNNFIQSFEIPQIYNKQLITQELINQPTNYNSESISKEYILKNYGLVNEYAWSGWFKWQDPVKQSLEYFMVSSVLTAKMINNEQFEFSCQNIWNDVGYPLYSFLRYQKVENIRPFQNYNKDDIYNWHFVYFGYSRSKLLAHVRIEFQYERISQVKFLLMYQILQQQFSLFIGSGPKGSPYSGQISKFRFNGGEGAFNPYNYQNEIHDIFGYKISKQLMSPQLKVPKQFDIEEMVSFQQQDQALLLKILQNDDQKQINQYGVSFWLRIMDSKIYARKENVYQQLIFQFSFKQFRRIDQPLVYLQFGEDENFNKNYQFKLFYLGKILGEIHSDQIDAANQDFISKLDAAYFKQSEQENVYTYNYLPLNQLFSDTSNNKTHQWIQFHYCFNYKLSRSNLYYYLQDVNFFQNFMHLSSPRTKQLKFQLGGQYQSLYPFVGQVSKVIASINEDIFINSLVDYKKYLFGEILPEKYTNYFAQVIIDSPMEFTTSTQVKEIVVPQLNFVSEFAWSGWFRWTGIKNPSMNQIFRISDYSLDPYILQDTTIDGQNIMTTYYYQLNGLRMPMQTPHNNQIKNWHYIYCGYQSELNIIVMKLDFNEQQFLTKKDAQYRLPYQISIFIGCSFDNQCYQGYISKFTLFGGEGAFDPFFGMTSDNYINEKSKVFETSSFIFQRLNLGDVDVNSQNEKTLIPNQMNEQFNQIQETQKQITKNENNQVIK